MPLKDGMCSDGRLDRATDGVCVALNLQGSGVEEVSIYLWWGGRETGSPSHIPQPPSLTRTRSTTP